MDSQVHSQQDNSAQQLQSQTVSSVHVRVQLRYTCLGMHSVRHGTSQVESGKSNRCETVSGISGNP